jgi:hypothetical protein
MNMSRVLKQKYVRNSLNGGQVAVLELLYKYRFGSRQLLASSLGVKAENGLYQKVEVLVKAGYVGKRFDKRLKLQGMPVGYYLTTKGLRALQALPDHNYINDQAMRISYKDKTVSNDFIAHTLSVYEHTQSLTRQYPGLKTFTRRDMSRYDYFPEQLPDAFLSLRSDDPEQPHRYFFDIVSDRTPRYVLDKRLANYAEFFESDIWEGTGSALPVTLLLSEWSPAEKRIQRSVAAQLNQLDSEMRVFTSTTTALEQSDDNRAIWTDVTDTDELLSFEAISVNP